MSDFRIDVSWLPPIHGPAEIAQTSASVEIKVCGKNATLVDDEWSKSVQTCIRVSAYPLALWLASSWWRLRWEPLRSLTPLPWRLAHELPSAGFGFLWPLLVFDSDGASIGIHCNSNLDSREPIRFLEHFRLTIPVESFVQGVDDFIQTVLARLSTCGVSGTTLETLWHDVLAERREPQLAALRKLEALLGCDPDEAPQDILDRLMSLAGLAGSSAVEEIAPVCSTNLLATLDQLECIAATSGVESHPILPLRVPVPPSQKPWEVGWELARQVRQHLGVNGDPISDSHLTSLLGLSSALPAPDPAFRKAPLSLAVRDPESGKLRLFFRKNNIHGLRFEAARFLGEHLLGPPGDRWLPVTDVRTNRQKTQRAFASELLCPIEPLRSILRSDLSQEAIEQVAEFFNVSPWTVTSTLVNHGDLSRDRLPD
ncbi:MAG: hypothetical protein JST93_37335 [Acidobacteria bacterium]|nr:hypothetical protein [Acidobacteriota bacterium]